MCRACKKNKQINRKAKTVQSDCRIERFCHLGTNGEINKLALSKYNSSVKLKTNKESKKGFQPI